MDSYIEINITKMKENIEYLRKNKKVCLMVKANNYGVGNDVLEYLFEEYNFYGVTTLYEAYELRKRNNNIEILICGHIDYEFFDECVKHNFSVSIHGKDGLVNIIPNLKYHLKIDVGMNRLGFKYEEIEWLKTRLETIQNYPTGIYTHLPEAINEELSIKQIKYFEDVIKRTNLTYEYIHCQNTIGAIKYKIDFVNMIRPGIGIWGLLANEKDFLLLGKELKNVILVHAKVQQVKEVTGPIGYDGIDIVDHKLIATIRLGYNDGFDRRLQGYIFKNKDKIVGNICMCQMMIEGNSFDEYYPIIKEQKDLLSLCEYANMITYEMLGGFSQRMIKKYKMEKNNDEKNK